MAGLDRTLAIAMGVGLAAVLRAKSTMMTAGLGNHVIATGELGGALLVSLLALAAPVAAVGLVALFCWFTVRLVRRLFRKERPADSSGVR